MHLTSISKPVVAAGGVALLAVVALIAFTHKTESPVAPAELHTSASAPANAEPVSRDNPNIPVVYAASPFASSEPALPPRYPSAVPIAAEAPAMETAAVVQPVTMRRRTYYRNRAYYRSGTRRRVVVRRRPFSHSVAIVGGSAAGGAIIGGLAGGGKGAGIGALAGGAGGLVYDRLTHKKTRVVRR